MIGKKKKKEMKEELEKELQEELQQESAQDLSDEAGKETACQPETAGDEKDQLIEKQQQQIAELNDKFLRTLAEFDNYRKRTMKERVELIQTASSEMILALLPVLDDFDRAVKAFEGSTDLNALQEGIVLVQQKFRTLLNQKGLEEMKSVGEVFDTDLHEAVANVPAAEEGQKNQVVDEVQKGYLLNGKVLRFAKVVVAN